MKNKTFKQMIGDLSVLPVVRRNRAAKARGAKLVDRLTAESVLVYSGMNGGPSLEGYHKPTVFPNIVLLYHGKQFKVKVWRHEGADSWPVVLDVTVAIIDPTSMWSEVLVKTNEKEFRIMRHATFFHHL